MSELRNCPQCGKIFSQVGFKRVCDKCARLEEKQLDTVSEFIRKKANREATMPEVAEATGVDVQHIYRWIQQGRLRMAGRENLGYPCMRCGNIIKSGTLCDECRGPLQSQMKEMERIRSQEEQKQQKESEQKNKKTYFND